MAGNEQQDAGKAGAQGGNAAAAGNPGRGADSLSGTPKTGAGQSQQSAAGGSSAGHYTGGAGAGTTRESGIVSTAAESNVGPAGAPQSSRGSAGGLVPGGATGAAPAGTRTEDGMGAAAGGGNPGTSGNMPEAGSQGGAAGAPADGERLLKQLGDPQADMPDASDSR